MGYPKASFGKRSFGTSMSALEVSPARRKRAEARRKAQERRWAAKSSAVRVLQVDQLPANSKLRD